MKIDEQKCQLDGLNAVNFEGLAEPHNRLTSIESLTNNHSIPRGTFSLRTRTIGLVQMGFQLC